MTALILGAACACLSAPAAILGGLFLGLLFGGNPNPEEIS